MWVGGMFRLNQILRRDKHRAAGAGTAPCQRGQVLCPPWGPLCACVPPAPCPGASGARYRCSSSGTERTEPGGLRELSGPGPGAAAGG